MAPRKSDELRLALERVWLNSRPEALERLAILKMFVRTLRSGAADRHSWERALLAAHRLAGSLGMFGFNEASCCAGEIEALLGNEEEPDVLSIARLVDRLGMLLEQTPASSYEPERREL